MSMFTYTQIVSPGDVQVAGDTHETFRALKFIFHEAVSPHRLIGYTQVTLHLRTEEEYAWADKLVEYIKANPFPGKK